MIKPKEDAKLAYIALIASCHEGISKDWDCSPEGFEAMISCLETINETYNITGDKQWKTTF